MKTSRLLRQFTARAAVALASLATVAAVHAATPEGPDVMAQQAVAYVHSMGAKAAYSALNSGPAFSSHDSWVAVIDADGKLLAHSGSPARVGQNVRQSSDANDIELARMFNDSLRSHTGSTSTYLVIDPGTLLPRYANARLERVGDVYVALGVYTDAVNLSEGW